jgi:hypothetical protein
MLHAMYYVMKQSITVNHATVEEPPKDSDFTPGPLISAKSLSRQVKHTMLLYIRETTKEVLDGLEREILSRTKHSWIVSFGVISIICLCIDEIPATISSVNETFPLRDDLEQEQATVLNIHADLENHPFGVITTIFRNTYHTRLNPLSDDFIPDTNSDWGEHETTFLTEIRQIIADHSKCLCMKPYLSKLTGSIPKSWSVGSHKRTGEYGRPPEEPVQESWSITIELPNIARFQ